MDIIVIKPPFGVSTSLAYKNVDNLQNKKYADIPSIIKGLKENKKIELEQGLLQVDTNIVDFRKILEDTCGGRFFMSGSGSAYYTFVQRHQSKEKW